MGDPYARAGSDRPRVAVVAGGEANSLLHGYKHTETLEQLIELGVPGHTVDVLAIDGPAPASSTAQTYDLIHLLMPAAFAAGWQRAAHAAGVPVVASYHPGVDYHGCELVLSPSRAADQLLAHAGVHADRIARFQCGVDVRRYHPARYAPDAFSSPEGFHILHVGGQGLELAVEAFLVARDHNPRLRLALAGAGVGLRPGPALGPGPREEVHRKRLGSHAVQIPAPSPDRLAQLYASSDLLLATATDDPAGAGIPEAQASGLPVLALDTGAARELIANGRSGCLVAPDPIAVAAALHGLARRATLLERLATGGLLATRNRTWEAALGQLGDAYTRALSPALPEVARAA